MNKRGTTMNKRIHFGLILLSFFTVLFTAAGITGAAAQESQFPAKTFDSVPAADYLGKVVILHSNDVHGAIDGYAKIAGLRTAYENMGAEVFVVDAGDFAQGDPYVNFSKGIDAVTMMNSAGYDLGIPGNHDFDFGIDQFLKYVKMAKFPVICANLFNDSKPMLEPHIILSSKNGTDIGFFGVDTPETVTKANPKLIVGLSFYGGSELYSCAQEQVGQLKDEGADLVIALAHLGVDLESSVDGNRSVDLYAGTSGIDFIIDGHSHTVMTEGNNGEPVQSTGTKFAYIGVLVINKNAEMYA